MSEKRIWTNRRKGSIIMNKHFLYIQIPKSGSTSVLNACKSAGLTRDMECCKHEGLLYLEQFINKDLPVYANCRNPFTHMFSYFFHKIHFERMDVDENNLKLEFEKFVRKRINNKHLRQYDYIRSNKNTKVTLVKLEKNDLIPTLNQRFNLKLSDGHDNRNKNKLYKLHKPNIKDFFTNKEIVNLIITAREKEFTNFKYSTNISDI